LSPYVNLYRRASEQVGTVAQPVGMHSPGFVAATDEEAKRLYPGYREIRHRIGAQRGWPPIRQRDFDAEVVNTSLYVGSVETVAAKIANAIGMLDVGRFDMIYSAAGTVSATASAAISRAVRDAGQSPGSRALGRAFPRHGGDMTGRVDDVGILGRRQIRHRAGAIGSWQRSPGSFALSPACPRNWETLPSAGHLSWR
jgi:hypothetical protein